MKKITLLFALMLMSTIAFGQIQKGDIQLSGNLNITKNKNTSVESSFFRVAPQASLFLSETTSLGVSLGYSSQKVGTGINEQKTDIFTYGVFARFYKSMGDKFYLFLQPAVNFGSGDINGTDLTNFSVSVAPGLAYFVSEKVAVEMNFGGLFYTSQDLDQTINTENYGLNFNLSNITVGASILLRK